MLPNTFFLRQVMLKLVKAFNHQDKSYTLHAELVLENFIALYSLAASINDERIAPLKAVEGQIKSVVSYAFAQVLLGDNRYSRVEELANRIKTDMGDSNFTDVVKQALKSMIDRATDENIMKCWKVGRKGK